MKRTTHLVELLLAVILASVLGLGLVWYFVFVPARKFRRGDPLAIARMAQKGPRVVPDMFEGLNSRDRSYRRACRKVLYDLWEHLSAEQRKVAAAGQLTMQMKAIDVGEQRALFTLRISSSTPCSMRMDGVDIHLLVNGNEVADFSHTSRWNASPLDGTIGLALTYNQCDFLLGPNDSIAMRGRSWFCVPPMGDVRNPKTVPGGFSLNWKTPRVEASRLGVTDKVPPFGNRRITVPRGDDSVGGSSDGE